MRVLVICSLLACLLIGCNRQSPPRAQTVPQSPPCVRIAVRHEDANAETVEAVIAVPLESVLACLDEVESITTLSSSKLAEVFVTAEPGTDPQQFLRKVHSTVESSKGEMPADSRLDGAWLVDSQSVPSEIESREMSRIKVRLDKDKASRYGISLAELTQTIESYERKPASDEVLGELANQTVTTVGGAQIRVGDVAEFVLVKEPSHRMRKWPPGPPTDGLRP